MSSGGARLAILALALVAAGPAAADYVRDEIRVNMRTGPGTQFRILKVLKSGDPVVRVGENGDWVNVTTPEGEEGWVPKGYLARTLPASLRLPQVEAQLAQAEGRIDELEAKLEGQAEAVGELGALRTRNDQLEAENRVLVGSAFWKNMGMGGLIALGGFVIGVVWPRGGPARTRKIKL